MPDFYEDFQDAHDAGHAANRADDMPKAEAAFRAALELAEDDADLSKALHALAHLTINSGRPQESKPFWERLAGLKKGVPFLVSEGHVAVGYNHEAEGRFDEALKCFAACKALKGGAAVIQASACFHSARIYTEQKKYPEALAELKAFDKIGNCFPDQKTEAPKLRKRIEQRMAKK